MLYKRIENLQKQLENNQACIITDGNNRFYFSGMRSSAGYLIITKKEAYLLIDFRYFEKAKSTVKHCKIMLLNKLYEDLKTLLNTHNIKEILLEYDNTTVREYTSFKEDLTDFSVTASKNISEKIRAIRSKKDESELKNIKSAQKLTDNTFKYILNKIKAGVTEKEIALDMEFFIRKNGSEGIAFDFIVVSGKNSSLPHGVPTDKPIENGDFITMDFGAVVNGYRSDMTRTVAVGDVSDRQRFVYDTVLKAQKSALDIIKPNVKCCDVDKTARDIIYNAGFEGCFGHGLGHSVGLDIHENPACNLRDKTLLQAGMIMTVEPGIYIENEFGVRIEDMVAITEDGYENLTKSLKELIILKP